MRSYQSSFRIKFTHELKTTTHSAYPNTVISYPHRTHRHNGSTHGSPTTQYTGLQCTTSQQVREITQMGHIAHLDYNLILTCIYRPNEPFIVDKLQKCLIISF